MRTLSALAQAAANAQQSDEVWLIRLAIKHASITPGGVIRLVNDMQHLVITPTQKLVQPLLDNWTAANGATMAARTGNAVQVTDPTAGTASHIFTTATGLTTGNATATIRVKKDATGKATRFCMFTMNDGGSNGTDLFLDTSTGEITSTPSGTGHVTQGVIDEGDHWVLYITRSGVTGYTAKFYPAVGSGTLGTAASGTLGSAIVSNPVIYQGTISNREVWVAFPFQLDLPGEDQEMPSVASLRIDNVDQQIIQAIRGLTGAPPTIDFEIVLASQPSTVEIGFYDMTLRSADYDALYIEAQMTFEQVFSEPLSVEMTPARFPGLF